MNHFSRGAATIRAWAILAATTAAACAGDPRAQQLAAPHNLTIAMQTRLPTNCPEIRVGFDPRIANDPTYAIEERDGLRVEYPMAFADPARSVIERFSQSMHDELNRVGLSLDQRIVMQVRWATCWPAPLRLTVRWRAPSVERDLPIPFLLLPIGREMTESVGLAALPAQTTFSFARELTRHALVMRSEGTVLEDYKSGLFKRRTGTLWFIEGMGTYVGANVCRRVGLTAPYSRQLAEAALGAVGEDVLDWDRFDNLGARGATYYLAAYGSIVRLEERLGADRFAELMVELKRTESVDGARLREAIEAAMGERLESLFGAEER
jgi:hypothetical protein